MPNISVKVDLTKNSFPGMGGRLRAGLQAAIVKAAHDVEAQAKARAAVDTGAMRNSITTQATGDLSAEVTTGVDYAKFVEYGTSRMSAQPFMHPAADAAKPGFEAAVKAVVEGLA